MKRIPIVILITALFTGACLFFDTCSFNPQKRKPDKTELIENEKKASIIDKNYQEAFVKLKVHSDSLGKKLAQTQSKLKVAKIKLNQSKITLIALAKKDTNSLMVMQQLMDFGSLKQQSLLFSNAVDTARSMYEANILQLEDLLAIRNSEILICKSSYEEMKSLNEENLRRERQLTEDLQTAYKQQRRKIFQNKLLSGSFLILAGITTTLYINSKQ